MKLVVAISLWLSLFTSIANAAPLPSWLPSPLQSKLGSLPTKRSSTPVATLYLCDPYCEVVGTFMSQTDFVGTSKEVMDEAALPEAASHLRVFIEFEPSESALLQSHDAEEITHKPEEPPAETKVAEKSGENSQANSADAKDSQQSESSRESREPQEPQEQEIPLRLGFHLDTLFGATSLNTSSNTDTASDALTHAVLGGGIDFQVANLATFGHGNLAFETDVSFWTSVAEKSKQNVAGDTLSTQTFRALFGGVWGRNRSPWKFGVLIEGRDENFNSDPDTAISFSTQYLWISPGVSLQYRMTRLRLFESVYNSTQDVDQYRGTQVTSQRFAVELESCKNIASILNGYFGICGIGGLEKLSVSGSGPVLQPVFTQSPTYSYTTWTAGIEFKFAGITL